MPSKLRVSIYAARMGRIIWKTAGMVDRDQCGFRSGRRTIKEKTRVGGGTEPCLVS